MDEPEEWRAVVGYEGEYEVSSLGRVRSHKRELRLLALCEGGRGYQQVTLSGARGVRFATVHALVAEAFLGPRPSWADVAHGDGCRQNNRILNLRYATRKENAADRSYHQRNGYPEPYKINISAHPVEITRSSDTEEWRAVVGWEGLYEVSSLGRVRSLDRVTISSSTNKTVRRRLCRGKVLRLSRHPFGYPMVGLRAQGRRRENKLVHQLVCIAFNGPAPPRHQVAHNDGNVNNPKASNLRWATAQSNTQDQLRHGTRCAGERVPNSKLTVLDVRFIREAKAVPGVEMARRYGVSKTTISNIRRGKIWKTPGAC